MRLKAELLPAIPHPRHHAERRCLIGDVAMVKWAKTLCDERDHESIAFVGWLGRALIELFSGRWPARAHPGRCGTVSRKRIRRPGLHHRDAALCQVEPMSGWGGGDRRGGLVRGRSLPRFPGAPVSPGEPKSEKWSRPATRMPQRLVIPGHRLWRFANCIEAH